MRRGEDEGSAATAIDRKKAQRKAEKVERKEQMRNSVLVPSHGSNKILELCCCPLFSILLVFILFTLFYHTSKSYEFEYEHRIIESIDYRSVKRTAEDIDAMMRIMTQGLYAVPNVWNRVNDRKIEFVSDMPVAGEVESVFLKSENEALEGPEAVEQSSVGNFYYRSSIRGRMGSAL